MPIRQTRAEYDDDRPLILNHLTVEDSPNEIPTGLVDKDGNPIVRLRPTVEWFGFVPLEEY